MKLLSVNSVPAPASGEIRLDSRPSRRPGEDPGGVVSALTCEHYRFWDERFGLGEGSWGRFGEDLTVQGMPEDRVHVGDVFRIGTAMAEVTGPGQPGAGIEPDSGIPGFARLILESGRVGFVLRILIGGRVRVGEDIQRLKMDPRRMTVRRVNELRHFRRHQVEAARRVLLIPALAPAWRREFQAIVGAAERDPRGGTGCCGLPV